MMESEVMADTQMQRRHYELPESRDRIVRFEELTAIIGRPRSSVYLMISRGEFPRGKKIGARAVGWMKSDIDAWLASR